MDSKRRRQDPMIISNQETQIEEKLHMIHWKTGIAMSHLRCLLEAIEKFSDPSQYDVPFYHFKNIFHCIANILFENYSKISEFWKQEEDLRLVGHQIFDVILHFFEQHLSIVMNHTALHPTLQQSLIWSVQILSKIGALLYQTDVSSFSSLLSLLSKYLEYHSNHEFKEQIQISIFSLLQHFAVSLSPNLLTPIFQLVTSISTTNHVKVKMEWIQTILYLMEHLSLEQSQWNESLQRMIHCCEDDDARVRALAIRVICLCCHSPHLQDHSLISTMYALTIKSLEDDHSHVQIEAMELLLQMAQRFHSYRISVEDAFDDSFCVLVNHAFCKLCKMLRKFDVNIRCKALEKMGMLEHVHPVFLLKTFQNMELHFAKTHTRGKLFHFEMLPEDEIQSTIRLKFLQEKSSTNDSSQVNVWSILEMQHKNLLNLLQSTSSTQEQQSVKQKLEYRDANLMKEDVVFAGPTGSFILGLEDEYMEVRIASIEAIAKIATKSKDFLKRATSYLLIMFGDEIEAVRIRAIECVTKMSLELSKLGEQMLQLSEEQLSIILSILEDANRQVRISIHHLLQTVSLPNATCLYACVSALLNLNLSKYMAEDREGIYFLLKNLASRHASFVNLLVDNLLNNTDHWSLLNVERNIEDVNYTCVMIVIYNALQQLPQMESSLPNHIVKDHFSYFKAKYPQYFPSTHSSVKKEENNDTIVNHLYNSFKDWKKMFEKGSIGIWKMILQQMNALQTEFKNTTSQQGMILFFSKLLGIMECYLSSIMTTNANEQLKLNCILKCFNLTYELQLKFSISNHTSLISMLKKIRLCCMINMWLHKSENRSSLSQFISKELKKRVEHILEHEEDFDLKRVFNQLDTMSEQDLHAFLSTYFPFSWSTQDFSSIQCVACRIEYPVSNTNAPKPLTFLNNISFEIQIKAILRNYQHAVSGEKDLFVILHLPNGKMMSFPLSLSKDLVSIGNCKHLIEYVLEMELKEIWSEAASIQVDIARKYKYDEEDAKSDFVLSHFHNVKNYFSLTGNHGVSLNLQIS